MSDIYLGSRWRHWDLHIHTPESYHHEFPGRTHEEKWENYLEALASLEDVQVLGITDYCTLKGYRRVRKHFDAGKLPNLKLVLPNLEFRLVEATKDGRNVNVHVIASPDIVDELPNILLGRLDMSHSGERYSCRYEDLVRFGRAFRNDDVLDEHAAFCVGAEQFKITRDQLKEAFNKSEVLRENALIAVPNSSKDGGSGVRQSGQRVLRLEIYRLADIIISANPADRDHFLGKDGKLSLEEIRRDYGGRMPCIGGSDAHRIEDIGKPDKDRYTWIKADPTFKGLNQICYEPKHRVTIGPNPPSEPVHQLRSVNINVPADAILKTEDSDGDEPFCMRDQTTIGFAPGLTCVIGGRGSGKSTLLSLLQEAAVGESLFFSDKSLQAGDSKQVVGDLVELDVTSSPDTIEFLDQNQIETFALDSGKLTQAVYSRLFKQDHSSELKRAVEDLKQELSALQELQRLILSQAAEQATLKDLRLEETSSTRLIESLKDDKYQDLSEKAELLSVKVSAVRVARKKLRDLVNQLDKVLADQTDAKEENPASPSQEEPYSERTSILLETVRVAVLKAQSEEDLSQPSPMEEDLNVEIQEINSQIAEFLKEKGISEENAQDLITASERLTEVGETIARTERRIESLKRQQIDVQRYPDAKNRFEEALQALIDSVNEHLRSGNEHLRSDTEKELQRISIWYEFDTKAAIRACKDSLIIAESDHHEGRRQLREDHVTSAFEDVSWHDLPQNVDEFVDALGGEKEASSETARRLIEHLTQPGEYERFRLQVQEHLSDALRFKRIEVLYDDKRLQQASFGQRCSAALIVLLMLGNQPIVIDEPEAHLDSALIANLLVDLIKQRKTERQIIFATHNANFVVNGDSELIHVLSLEGDGPTTIKSTSLEDHEHRHEVLQLEGGEEAFAQREKRYGFRSRFSKPVGT